MHTSKFSTLIVPQDTKTQIFCMHDDMAQSVKQEDKCSSARLCMIAPSF